ncbi:MAG: single-stranded DNA-binding protein [Oscillochloridaceae bacterium umkhey_bin13]
MADYCRVTIVGNLSSDIRQTRSADDPRQVIGVTTVCVSRTQLTQGEVEHRTTLIPVEIVGAARAARAAQLFGAGSRIVLDGHLELRETAEAETLPAVNGQREVAVIVPRTTLVLVVDAIFNADLPTPAPEAQLLSGARSA